MCHKANDSASVVYEQDPKRIRRLPPARHDPNNDDDDNDDDDDLLLFRIARVTSSLDSRLPTTIGFSWRAVDKVPDVVIYFDGGAREEGCASAVVAQSYTTDSAVPIMEEHAIYFVNGTNNMAEHLALCGAAKLAKRISDHDPSKYIVIVGDSLIATQQLAGSFTVRQPHLLELVKESRAILAIAPGVAVLQAPRAFNRLADALSTFAIQHKQNVGDPTLFPAPPEKPSKRVAMKTSATGAAAANAHQYVVEEEETPLTLDDMLLLRTFPTRLTVPRSVAPLWGNLVKHAIQRCLSVTDDDKLAAMIKLSCLPSLFLRSHLRTQKVAWALRRGRISKPTSTASATFGPRPRPQPNDNVPATKAEKFAAAGQLRKAAQALKPATILNPTPEVLRMLASKYPEEDPAFRVPVAMTKALRMIPTEVVVKVITSMNPVAASGLDRWTPALLVAAARCVDGLWDLIAELVHMLLVKQHLFHDLTSLVRGIALAKDGGNDVRPIGVGGFWLKLTGMICLEMDDPLANLPCWQKGCSKRGGHQIIQKVRNWLEQHDDNAIMTIDVANAFNSVKRCSIDSWLNQSKGHEFIRCYWNLSYTKCTTVLVQDGNTWHRIASTRGTRQGDPAAGYLFAVIMASAIENAKCEVDANVTFPWQKWSPLLAFFDDITVMADDIRSTAVMMKSIVTHLSFVGLAVNPSKCEILYRPGSNTTLHLPWLRQTGIRTVDASTSSVKLLGASIGCTNDQIAFLNFKKAETSDIIERCVALGAKAPRAATAIMRFCLSPKMRYRFETHSPSLCKPIAVALEEDIAKAIRRILMIPENDLAASMNDLIFSSFATNIPAYSNSLQELWNAANSPVETYFDAKAQVVEALVRAEAGVLLRYRDIAARLTQQRVSAPYVFSPFLPTSCNTADFRTIAALFLAHDIVPPATKCMCGFKKPPDDKHGATIVQHLLECNRIKGVGLTFRHNLICAAIGTHFTDRGYMVTHEPHFYEMNYEDHKQCRPDVTIFSTPPLALDVTVSKDTSGADAAKVVKHKTAVEKAGHNFLPIPIGTFGELSDRLDQTMEKVFSKSAKFISGFERHSLRKAVIDAWITGTASIIRNVCLWNITGDWEAAGDEKDDVYAATLRMKTILSMW